MSSRPAAMDGIVELELNTEGDMMPLMRPTAKRRLPQPVVKAMVPPPLKAASPVLMEASPKPPMTPAKSCAADVGATPKPVGPLWK